ncbi:MAG: hypothetical protein IJO33_03645 [Bacilli bacterium]|nr:hypothetical protein [Bacilli bacterium]
MEFNVIKKLFICIKENDSLKLNAQILMKYGINNNSISTLLNKKILQRRIKGEYGVSPEHLYLYAKKLSHTEYVDQALELFMSLKELMQLSSKSKHYLVVVDYECICYQMFKLYISKEDFANAYEYFKKIGKRKCFFNQICYILLNYLLGNKIRAVEDIISFEDLLEGLNEIKTDCQEHNFRLALNQLEQLELDCNFVDSILSKSKINILKILLNKCIEKQNELIGNIFDFYANTGVNFEIACLQFELDVYQINILKLLIAKYCYSINDFEKGDLYFYSVLESDYQNDKTKSLIEEIEEKENLSNLLINNKLVDKLFRKKNS